MQLQYKKNAMCNGRQKMENRSGDTAVFAEKPRASPSSDCRLELSCQKTSAEQSPWSREMQYGIMECLGWKAP